MNIFNLLNNKEPIEPETLTALFPELSELDHEKILVIKVIMDTTFVQDDMDIFENAVQVLNGISPDIYKTEGCLPEHIWYAVKTIKQVSSKEFSYEVLEYIKWIYKDNGLKFLPDIPEFKTLNKPILDDVIAVATDGPFPLNNTTMLNIQAMQYLRIKNYLLEKQNEG